MDVKENDSQKPVSQNLHKLRSNIHVAYGSDLDFVKTTLKKTTNAQLFPEMAERIIE